MTIETPDDYELAKIDLDVAIAKFAREAKMLGVYMPALATYLRIHADDLADRFPDDTNGGAA